MHEASFTRTPAPFEALHDDSVEGVAGRGFGRVAIDLREEDSVLATVLYLHRSEQVVPGIPHEDPYLAAALDHDVAQHVAIETDVERDPSREIASELEAREETVLRLISGNPSKWFPDDVRSRTVRRRHPRSVTKPPERAFRMTTRSIDTSVTRPQRDPVVAHRICGTRGTPDQTLNGLSSETGRMRSNRKLSVGY